MLCTDAWLLFFLLKITVTIHDKIILYDFCKISSFSLTESEHQYAHFVQIMLSLQGSHSLFHTLGTSSLLSALPFRSVYAICKTAGLYIFRPLPKVKLA